MLELSSSDDANGSINVDRACKFSIPTGRAKESSPHESVCQSLSQLLNQNFFATLLSYNVMLQVQAPYSDAIRSNILEKTLSRKG